MKLAWGRFQLYTLPWPFTVRTFRRTFQAGHTRFGVGMVGGKGLFLQVDSKEGR